MHFRPTKNDERRMEIVRDHLANCRDKYGDVAPVTHTDVMRWALCFAADALGDPAAVSIERSGRRAFYSPPDETIVDKS